jgi:hypothetical protein
MRAANIMANSTSARLSGRRVERGAENVKEQFAKHIVAPSRPRRQDKAKLWSAQRVSKKKDQIARTEQLTSIPRCGRQPSDCPFVSRLASDWNAGSCAYRADINGRSCRKSMGIVSDLGGWETDKSAGRLSSKFVSEVLLCFSEIELVDQEEFASVALLELADQKRV